MSETKCNYLVVEQFMISELKLSGNELLVYALIYGFSRDGNGVFYGSANYISSFCGASERCVLRILKSLVERGLLKKGVQQYNHPCYSVMTKCHDMVTKCHDKMSVDGDKMSYNTLLNNISLQENKKVKVDKQPCEYEKIESAYIDSFQELYKQGKLFTEKPIVNYGAVRKRIKQIKSNYKLDDTQIIGVIEKAKSEQWILGQGFSFMTILSDSQINKLLNAKEKSTSSPKQNNWLEKERAANDSGVW